MLDFLLGYTKFQCSSHPEKETSRLKIWWCNRFHKSYHRPMTYFYFDDYTTVRYGCGICGRFLKEETRGVIEDAHAVFPGGTQ